MFDDVFKNTKVSSDLFLYVDEALIRSGLDVIATKQDIKDTFKKYIKSYNAWYNTVMSNIDKYGDKFIKGEIKFVKKKVPPIERDKEQTKLFDTILDTMQILDTKKILYGHDILMKYFIQYMKHTMLFPAIRPYFINEFDYFIRTHKLKATKEDMKTMFKEVAVVDTMNRVIDIILTKW